MGATTMIDLCEADPTVTGRLGVNDGVFAARFFVSDINAFIHFEATDTEIALS
jgi:hypothetical protein